MWTPPFLFHRSIDWDIDIDIWMAYTPPPFSVSFPFCCTRRNNWSQELTVETRCKRTQVSPLSAPYLLLIFFLVCIKITKFENLSSWRQPTLHYIFLPSSDSSILIMVLWDLFPFCFWNLFALHFSIIRLMISFLVSLTFVAISNPFSNLAAFSATNVFLSHYRTFARFLDVLPSSLCDTGLRSLFL